MAQVQLSEADIEILLMAMYRFTARMECETHRSVKKKLLNMRRELQAKDAAKEPTR